MNRAFMEILALLLMPISGCLAVLFRRSVFFRYFAFVFYPFLLCGYFIIQMFEGSAHFSYCWFSMQDIKFEFAIALGLPEIFICIVIILILACIQLACIKLEKACNFDQLKIQLYISLFVTVMCLTVMSENLLSFFIGMESLGLISSFLIGHTPSACTQSVRAFIFSKFASLLFLIGIIMIGSEIKSFDFSMVKIAFDDIENHKSLILPSTLLLIACFCKSAQFPFSRWLIDASIANIYISIIIHTATIVGISIIFISKCYFIFEPIPSLKYSMIIVGLFSAVVAALSSMLHSDIKKIIACSTISSIGCVFVACGIGEYSAAILYFICHAFFKSIFFLSFIYVMDSVSYEKKYIKNGRRKQINSQYK